ncbi:MAG: cohesin domain-containing protein [Oscillospiraceae bacterium]
MKTSKKFIAGISALALVMSTSMVATVSAVTTDENTDFTVSISSTETDLEAGATFNVTVDLVNVPESGIAGCEFAVSFDNTKVELQSITENTGLTGDASNAELEIVPDLGSTMINGDTYSCLDYNITDGKVAFLWATGLGQDYFIKQDGTLVTLTFKVVEDAEAGSSELSVDAIRDGGEVLFAGLDETGNYAEENVAIDQPLNIVVGGEGTGTTTDPSVTDPSVTDPSVTDPSVTDPTAEPEFILGDFNCDGQVKSNDLIAIRRVLLHLDESPATDSIKFKNGDVNGDGQLKSNDILKIRRVLLHLDEGF